jgi:hypothetical protein
MLKNNQNSGGQSDNQLFVLNLVEKVNDEAVSPYFKVLKKNPETTKWEDSGNNVTEITGDLASIALSSYTWKGDEIVKVNLIIEDSDNKEAYLLSFNFKSLTRSVFNSILALESPKGLSLKAYRNKKGRVAIYVTQNGEGVSWKYSIEELPQPIEITHPKTGAVISRDYDEVNDFFIKELEAAATRLNIRFGDGSPKAEKENVETKADGSSSNSESAEDELPEDLF